MNVRISLLSKGRSILLAFVDKRISHREEIGLEVVWSDHDGAGFSVSKQRKWLMIGKRKNKRMANPMEPSS